MTKYVWTIQGYIQVNLISSFLHVAQSVQLAAAVIDTTGINTIPAHGLLGVDLPDIANATVTLQVTVDPIIFRRSASPRRSCRQHTHWTQSPTHSWPSFLVAAVPCHLVLHTADTLDVYALGV